MARAVILSAVDRQPFRFAVQATNASDARDWREFVCKVEDLGYSCLMLADHYLGPGPAQQAARTPRQDLAPIAAIAAAAAHTTVLRVGCRVFCIDYHVPAVLAKEAATLDLLSDGRLELGIGAGWSGVEYEAMGLTFDTPGRRISKLKEVVALIKAHCSRRRTRMCGRVRERRRLPGNPATCTTSAPAHHDRRRRQEGADVRGPGGGHRQHQHGAVCRPHRRRPDPAGGGERAGSVRPGRRPGRASAISTSRVHPTSSQLSAPPTVARPPTTARLRTRAWTRRRECRSRCSSTTRTSSSAPRTRSSKRLQARREMYGVNYVTVQQKQAKKICAHRGAFDRNVRPRGSPWRRDRDSPSTRTVTPTTSSNSPTTASCSCSATPTATAWCGAGRRMTICRMRSAISPATARSRC